MTKQRVAPVYDLLKPKKIIIGWRLDDGTIERVFDGGADKGNYKNDSDSEMLDEFDVWRTISQWINARSFISTEEDENK
jgi:hypothetical protein